MFKFGTNYTPKKSYQRVYIDSVDENVREEEQYKEAACDDNRRIQLLSIKIQSEQKQRNLNQLL